MLSAAIIKELKLLSRDLHGVAVLFIMPILFMFIMSSALSNDNQVSHSRPITLLANPNDALNQNLLKALKDEGLNIRLADNPQLTEAQASLQDGKINLIIENPNTEKTALNKEQAMTLWINPTTDRSWLLGIKGIVQKHYTQIRLNHYFDATDAITLKAKGLPKSTIKKIQSQITEQTNARFKNIQDYLDKQQWHEIYLNRTGSESTRPNSVQHSVPAWLIFGMFFIMIPLSNVMATERHTNTLTRLRMARAPATVLILGKFVPYFLINQIQFIGMLLLGIFVLPLFDMSGLQLSGDLSAYLILSCAVSLSALGYGLLVSVITKTSEQAVVLGGGGIIIMAALGGIMVPTYIMPTAMQTVAQFSPMNWGLTAFQNLLLNHDTLMQIHLPLLYLGTFGISTLLIATYLYRRQLLTQVHF